MDIFSLDFLYSLVPLGKTLLRMLAGICLGLFIANCIEALNWTRNVAKLASPLVRVAHLSDVSGAAFSLTFFSPAAGNMLLSEHLQKGTITRFEVFLANIFNSLPSYFVHLPTVLLFAWSVLGFPALVYTSITLSAALLRTCMVIVFGHIFISPVAGLQKIAKQEGAKTFTFLDVLQKSLVRVKKRLPRIMKWVIPCYILVIVLQRYGFFTYLEHEAVVYIEWLPFLRAESLGVIVLSIAAESGAALSTAGALLDGAVLSEKEIVMALLVGNIVSTPLRAFRHQFPAYAGYFEPKLALQLIVVNQSLRAISIALLAWGYWVLG